MTRTGALQIIGLLNPEAVEGHQAAFIGFKVMPEKAQSTIRRIESLAGVVSATIVSGRFDVMAVVMFNKEHSYRRFIDEELPRWRGFWERKPSS